MLDCVVCSSLPTQTCTTCRKIDYCSEDCQEADAHVHNIICRAVKNFTTPRPSSNHYVAFVFPEPPATSRDDENDDADESDANKPKLVWIKSTYNKEEDYFESNEDEIEAAMGITAGDGVKHATDHVDGDEKFIRIWRHKVAGLMGLRYNSFINEIDEECDWRGPVLIQTGAAGDLLEPLGMQNMEAKDMKDIATFCRDFGRALG